MHRKGINAERGLAAKLRRYTVKFIERDGYPDKVVVWADSKGEARQIAERRGYEDIIKVRRVGFPVMPLVLVLLILAGIFYLVVR